ncbi:MAG: rRNA maturation RNase YbeY [Burkholderiales bacterium]
MAQPSLLLSLQFARDPLVRAHRSVLTRATVTRCIRAALEAPAEITVRIVGEEEGRQLNRDYRQKDYATNVLTFDYVRQPTVLADLVLCASVIEKEAMEMGVSLQAHYAHLLVHGSLHAQGYDHENEVMAEEMERLETKILEGLGFDDPYKKTQ